MRIMFIPEVAVFGLTPAASKGLLTLVADACRGGTEIPLGVELVGLLDNELRCMFAPIDLTDYYLTDATFSGGSVYYWQLTTGGGGGGGFGDFYARFPAGASIGSSILRCIS